MSTKRRCVHLDFHTSPEIEGIGVNFSKEKFQQAVKVANAQSITVFAKCHHGYSYYPTKIGTMHPHLNFDLLGTMLDSAHEIGIKAPIYIPVGWSALDAEQNPQWISKHFDGTFTMNYDINAKGSDKKPHASWINLCASDNSYAQYIYDITHEICQNYQVDGILYDICFVSQYCVCDECKKGMLAQNLNPENLEDCKAYFEQKRLLFTKKCADILHSYYPDATVFFNSGGADINNIHRIEYETHIEMEDLPTAWGGYDKMPLRAKVFKQTGKDYLGMTAKFHYDWGEFGGYKTKEALMYEACAMSLYGAGCSIGDHLHPDGDFEIETYENMGYAFDYFEKIEPYAFNGETETTLGVYLSKNPDANHGTVKILCENQYEFDIVINNDFNKYQTLIFPDGCVLDEDCIKAVKQFVKDGKKVLFEGTSLIKDNTFFLDCGGKYIKENDFDCDYIHLFNAKREIPDAPVLCYKTSNLVENVNGTVFAKISLPYFSRTYDHYCGHKNTPFNKAEETYAGIIQKDNVIYVANPLSANYFEFGAVMHKRIFMEALDKVYKPQVEINLYSQGRISFIHQKQFNRYCLGMLYASPVKRGKAEIIEDIVPIYNIPVTVKTEKSVKKVYSPITKKQYDFVAKKGKISFSVDKLDCHDIIVIEY